MPIGQTYSYTRHTYGDNSARGEAKGFLNLSYGYTDYRRRPQPAGAATVMAASATSNTGSTTYTFSPPITLDSTRAISITTTGTAASVAATAIVVTGTNVEGKTITESLTPTAATLGTLNGTKAFKWITKIVIPQQTGTGVLVSIGTQNLFGLHHRLQTGTTASQVRVISVSNVTNLNLTSGSATTSNLGANGIPTVQAVPTTLNVDPSVIELNTFVPATAPTGNFSMHVHYYFVKWNLQPVNDGTKDPGQRINLWGVSR